MSCVNVSPGVLTGCITVPPSKSDVHRAILCAALAKGKSKIYPVDFSQDISATIDCVKALGAKVTTIKNGLLIDGSTMFQTPQSSLDCRESGSTLRFMIPIAAVSGAETTFTGKGRLPDRPIGIYLDCLPKHGVTCTTERGLPLTIKGSMQSGLYEIPGDISSQFITGLLLALPLLEGNSEIRLTSPAQSIGYINMTLKTMKEFGVYIQTTSTGYQIQGGQQYTPYNYTCEGDWSQGAFFIAAGALGGNIELRGLTLPSLQGDSACVDIFKQFGATVTTTKTGLQVTGDSLTATTIDAENIPDLVPILAVTAAFAHGTTYIKNAERLRIKESDRLKATCHGLIRLGAICKETEDGLMITGVPSITGGKAQGFNDHRIVMALSIAAAKSTGDITITDKESIEKSYPNFFKDYYHLNGKVQNITK